MIDGHGMAMFVNHSCDPNCEVDEIDGRIFIKTRRNLKAGDELTYDYWLYDGDDEAPCHCGSKRCRGSMYSPAELKRLKRVAAEAKARARAVRRKRNKRQSVRRRPNPAHDLGLISVVLFVSLIRANPCKSVAVLPLAPAMNRTSRNSFPSPGVSTYGIFLPRGT